MTDKINIEKAYDVLSHHMEKHIYSVYFFLNKG